MCIILTHSEDYQLLCAEHCEEPGTAGGEGLALFHQGPPHGGEEGQFNFYIVPPTIVEL